MKIEIKGGGLIKLTTQKNMMDMDMEELYEIEKAIKAVRYLVEILNIKKLSLEIH